MPQSGESPNDTNSEPRKGCRDSVLLFLAEFLKGLLGAYGPWNRWSLKTADEQALGSKFRQYSQRTWQTHFL